MGKFVKSGVRLQIRQDRPNNVIRAFFATDDGSERWEVATLSMGIADNCKPLFDLWAEMLGEALKMFVSEATGLSPDQITNFTQKPHEMN